MPLFEARSENATAEFISRQFLSKKDRLLNPRNGQTLSEVDYTIVLYDEVVETYVPTRNEVEGGGQVEVFITHADLPAFSSSRLTLELKDGRRVTGLFKKISGGLLYFVKKGQFDEPPA